MEYLKTQAEVFEQLLEFDTQKIKYQYRGSKQARELGDNGENDQVGLYFRETVRSHLLLFYMP